ncbi:MULTISPECIES: hypothetical protein [Weissella]|uniref:hypothetical protein n=1 Tax=Weissella TaxID=46255 RepID=UPI00189858DD|nr:MULTISPECIES: hypothetical protein [Weissella]
MKNTETDILASELPIVEEKGQFKTLEETIQQSGNWVPVAWWRGAEVMLYSNPKDVLPVIDDEIEFVPEERE